MKKKYNIGYEGKDENAFALSTGDLMAGLLFIFILLLVVEANLCKRPEALVRLTKRHTPGVMAVRRIMERLLLTRLRRSI